MCRSLAEGGRRCPAGQSPGHNARRRARRTLARLGAAGVPAELAAASRERFFWWDRGEATACAPSRVRPVTDPTSVMWKPAGGLWTAPALDDDGPISVPATAGIHTAWTDFVAGNGDDDDVAGGSHLTEVAAAGDAVVVRIATDEDVAAASRRWPLRVETQVETVDGWSYEAMVRDGVHAVDIIPSSRPASLRYGFDAPTRLWLTPAKVCLRERIALSWA